MFFIGIITNPKNEKYIKTNLSAILPEENVIFINDKNIYNIKNIKFETIVIDCKIKNVVEIRKIISNAKYIILNEDIEMNIEIINNLNLTVITYGFNNKSTFAVSSINESTIIICLQRIILSKSKQIIEPQEFQIEITENIEIYAIITTYIIKILYL